MTISQPTIVSGVSRPPHLDPLCHRVSLGMAVLAAIWMLPSQVVLANPTGGAVVGGSATITQTPGVTTVNQSSNRAVINWKDFSIGNGELTQFKQPDRSSIALNRVTGKNPSNILGQLKANGNVWLVNRNGILFGPNAKVNVQGLIATTADITDQNFLAGHDDFSIPSPNPEASVVNEGSITLGEYGLGGLVAPHVRNSGVITGRLSQVVIAGTPTFALDYYGDGLIQFAATSKVTENSDPSQPLVKNDGKISVDGGDILITADAAAEVVNEVINTDGVIEAHSITEKGGVIVLKGGDDGLVHVAGTLDASSPKAGVSGGSVDVLGNKVLVADGSRIDVSGPAGGGTVHVGGDLHGVGELQTATQTLVMPETRITADATESGDGGLVVVWADDSASIGGKISARGGPVSGNGGFVETSGNKQLELNSSPDASAPNGNAGAWLIDPADITIQPGYPIQVFAAAAVVDFGSSVVYAGLISDALDGGNDVILNTSTALDGQGLGNITQLPNATISKAGGGDVTLTLRADNDIVLNDGILSFFEGEGRLNVTLNADRDENGAGAIAMMSGTTVSRIRVSGDVIMGGGSDPLTKPAMGTSDHIDGILVDGGSIYSDQGDISLQGRGNASGNGYGIRLTNSATISNGDYGNISLSGAPGGTNTVGVSVASQSGISNNLGATTFDAGLGSVSAGPGTNNFLGTIFFKNVNNVDLWNIDDIEIGASDVSGSFFVESGLGKSNGGMVVSGPVKSGSDMLLYAFGDISVQADISGSSVDIEAFDGGVSNSGSVTSTINDVAIWSERDIIINQSITSAKNIELNTYGEGDINQVGTAPLIGDRLTIESWGGIGDNLGDINLLAENRIGTITAGRASDSEGGGSFNAMEFTNAKSLVVERVDYINSLELGVNGNVNLAGTIATSGGGTSILIDSQSFTNSYGSGAMGTGDGGRYLVYSKDPANDSRNLPSGEFGKRYNFPFDPDDPQGAQANTPLPTDGNFFLYAVNPTLTVAADNVSRVYGDPVHNDQNDPKSDLKYTISGLLIDGDILSDAVSGSPTLTTSAVQTSDAGAYPIDIGPGTIISPLEYTLKLVNGEVTVTQAPLAISANDSSRPYGAKNPAFTASFDGFKNADNAAVINGLRFRTPAELLSEPGRYDIVPFGASAANYIISYENGTLAINPGSILNHACDGCTVVTEISPTMPLNSNVHIQPGAPHLLTPDHEAVYSVPKIQQVHEPGDLLFSNDGNRELWGL